MTTVESRLLKEIEADKAFSVPLMRVRAARDTSALLRGLRVRAGLTQTALAERLHVSQARISQVESGTLEHLASLDFIYLYADACGEAVKLTPAMIEPTADSLPAPDHTTGATEGGTQALQPTETFHIYVNDDSEVITSDVPGRSKRLLGNLDSRGIVKRGTVVRAGDYLVGKIAPRISDEATPEEKLLGAMFGEATPKFVDKSLRVPSGVSGKVKSVMALKGPDATIIGVSVVIALEVSSAETAGASRPEVRKATPFAGEAEH